MINEETGMEDFTLDAQLRDFYRVSRGFLLQWQYLGHDDPKRIITGSAHIVSALRLFDPDETNAPFGLVYERPPVIDDMGEADQVTLHFSRDGAPPKLMYKFQDSDRVHRLGLDFNGYLEMLLKARAMYRWQQFFIDDETFSPPPWVEQKFRDDMQLVFPEVDLSPFTFKR